MMVATLVADPWIFELMLTTMQAFELDGLQTLLRPRGFEPEVRRASGEELRPLGSLVLFALGLYLRPGSRALYPHTRFRAKHY